jgi:hypothetical protein
MTSTVAGMQIECSDEHSANAPLSIRFNLESDSKVNEESDVHIMKQPSPRISTDAGIQIDWNDRQPTNAYPQISFNLEPDSNVSESDWQPAKDAVPRFSIVASNVRSDSNPKYRRIDTQLKSVRRKSVTIRCSFSG